MINTYSFKYLLMLFFAYYISFKNVIINRTSNEYVTTFFFL